jgi:hypothetical protein
MTQGIVLACIVGFDPLLVCEQLDSIELNLGNLATEGLIDMQQEPL